MPRPRKPTAILELTGAFKKDPQRKKGRENEPISKYPIGEPPESFDEDLQALWFEISDQVPDGVLKKADRLVLEIACRMTHKLRAGNIQGNELSTLTTCLTRMGLTPADRSKIAIPKEKEEQDELAALAAESRSAFGNRPN